MERCPAQSQRLLETLESPKLDVTKALWLAIKLVFDNADVGDFATIEEILDVGAGHVPREVAKMSSVWGLVGKGKLLALVSASCASVSVAGEWAW